MGSFYTNITLRTEDRDAVCAQLSVARRHAYVSPSTEGAIVVFDLGCEEQDPKELGRLASQLSQGCACPSLAIMIHDDSVLWYGLYLDGALADEYTSAPSYFEGGDAPPAGGDAARLCAAFGRLDVEAELHGVLHRVDDSPDAYMFASERHTDIVRVLGLPTNAVGTGYNYLDAGELPPGLTMEDLVRIG